MLSYLVVVLVYVWQNTPHSHAMDFDDGQIPYETVNFSSTGNKGLFKSCFPEPPSLQATYHTITVPGGGRQYTRYRPAPSEVDIPTWSDVNTEGEVGSVLDCALAAEENRSAMFKYRGVGSCQVTRNMFDVNAASSTGGGAVGTEAVYVAESPCIPPSFDGGLEAGLFMSECLYINTDQGLKDDRAGYCRLKQGMTTWADQGITNRTNLVDMILARGNGGTRFLVGAHYDKYEGRWEWTPGGRVVAAGDMIPTGLDPSHGGAGYAIYIEPGLDYKINSKRSTAWTGGVVCSGKR